MASGTWKIKIGAADFADYTDVLNPEGVSGGPSVRPFEGYGASQPVFINLGNSKIVQKFTMTRTHATDTAAHSWYQTAIATYAGVADVLITHIDYEGAETTWKISGADVQLEVATPIGPTTITKISFTGTPVQQP